MLAQTRRSCHLAAVPIVLIGAAWAFAMAEPRQLADLPAPLAAMMREARAEAERVAATSADAASRADAWGSLGMLYHAHRLRFLARDAYARALQDANTMRWRYLHGIALSELGEIEGAVAEFRLVAQAAPGDFPAWYRLGVALLLTGDVDGAQAALDRARALDAESALVLAAQADVASARSDHRAALDLLTRAFEIEPEAGQLVYKLALAERAVGNAEAASAWLAKRPDNSLAPKIDDPILLDVAQMSRSSRFYEIAADWALDRGDLAGAADALERASALAPDDIALLLRLVAALDDADRRDEAAAAVRRALSIADNAQARAWAAAFDMRAARFASAIDHYRRLTALVPDDAYGHYWLGIAQLGAGDCDGRTSLTQALRLRPNRGDAHIALARADALCGFAESALRRANALRDLKDDADTRITLAFAAASVGRRDDADSLATADLPHPDAHLLLDAMAGGRLPDRPFARGSDRWLPPEIR